MKPKYKYKMKISLETKFFSKPQKVTIFSNFRIDPVLLKAIYQ